MLVFNLILSFIFCYSLFCFLTSRWARFYSASLIYQSPCWLIWHLDMYYIHFVWKGLSKQIMLYMLRATPSHTFQLYFILNVIFQKKCFLTLSLYQCPFILSYEILEILFEGILTFCIKIYFCVIIWLIKTTST